MQENSKSFYDLLRDSSPKLADQLDIIKKRGHEEWIPMLRFSEGSHGGYPHIRNVEHNADRLVPDKIKKEFGPGEIFLLLSAIFLHDIGKVITGNFLDPTSDSPCKKMINENGDGCKMLIEEIKDRDQYDKDKDPPCRKENRVHIYESQRIIREYWGMLGLPDERIAEYCAVIAFCHGLKYPLDSRDDKYIQNQCKKAKEIAANFRNTSLEPYGRLRIPLLASILRLADETDNCWTRSLEQYWFRNLNPESYFTFVKAFRRRVEDVEFCCAGQCIIMHIPETEREKENELNIEETKALSSCRADTLEALNKWSEPLKVLGISYKDVFFEHNNYLYNSFDSLFADIKSGKQENKPKYFDLFDGDIDRTREELNKLVEADKIKKEIKGPVKAGNIEEAIKKLVKADKIKWLLNKLVDSNEIKEMFKILVEEDKTKGILKKLAGSNEIKKALKKAVKDEAEGIKETLKLAEAGETNKALKRLIEANETKGIFKKLMDDNDAKETLKELVGSDDIKEALKRLIETDETTEILKKLAESNVIKEALNKIAEDGADEIKEMELAEAGEIKKVLKKLIEADEIKGILKILVDDNDLKEMLKKLEDAEKTKETLKKLVDAIKELSLGSLGYKRFRWKSLEGKIGRTLTDRDKWLVERLYPESEKLLNVIFLPGSEYIEISFDRKDVERIYHNLGIPQPK